MKKLFVAFLFYGCLVCFTPFAQARTQAQSTMRENNMEVSIWAGYTSTFLRGITEEMDDWRDMLDAVGYDNNLSASHNGSAMNLGANLDFPIAAGLKAGPRLGLLFAFPAEVQGERVNASYHYDWTNSISGTMFILAGGAVLTVWEPGPYFSLDLGADLGLGLVSAGWKSTLKTDDPNFNVTPYTYDIPLGGSCLYLDLNTTAKYHFQENMAAYVRVGYRISDMDYLTVGKEFNNIVPFGDIRAGNPFRGLDDDPIAYDLSGFELIVGAEYSF